MNLHCKDTREENFSVLRAALNTCKEQQCLKCPTTGAGLGMLPSFHGWVPRQQRLPKGLQRAAKAWVQLLTQMA